MDRIIAGETCKKGALFRELPQFSASRSESTYLDDKCVNQALDPLSGISQARSLSCDVVSGFLNLGLQRLAGAIVQVF
jgi:hypothetical protein